MKPMPIGKTRQALALIELGGLPQHYENYKGPTSSSPKKQPEDSQDKRTFRQELGQFAADS